MKSNENKGKSDKDWKKRGGGNGLRNEIFVVIVARNNINKHLDHTKATLLNSVIPFN